jgi:hypothetical protein
MEKCLKFLTPEKNFVMNVMDKEELIKRNVENVKEEEL